MMGVEFTPAAHGASVRRWKPYTTYKDSGVEWLGKIPVDWEVQKLKHIAKVNLSNVDKKTNEDQDSVKLCNYVDVYYNDYITYDLSFMEATASFNQIGKFVLRAGDVIITKDSESWEDIAVPAYVPADLNDVICGYHLAHIRPDYADINGEYLFRSFCATRLNNQFRVEAHGITRFGLGKYWIDNSLFPVPPINEQKSIAAFLDRKTAHIDTLISKKERLITLLQEKRAALISHTVTKGLDSDVPMKDSGVEWLGEIPAHWEVQKLKHVAKINLSNVDKKTKEYEDSIRLCNYVDVYNNDYIDSNLNFMEATASPNQIKKFALKEGDVIITKDSESWEDIAIPSYVPANLENVICSYHLAHIRPNYVVINGEYIFRSFSANCLNYQFKVKANGITRFGISKYSIDNSLFLVPPINEQKSIVSFLDSETIKIDALISKIQEAIEKLQEYRIALISAAVTGKIDVRNENRN